MASLAAWLLRVQEERGAALGPIGVTSAFLSNGPPTGALSGVRPTTKSHVAISAFVQKEIPNGCTVGLGKEVWKYIQRKP